MKTTAFKVHSIYSKKDIQDMQKVAGKKTRRIGMSATVLFFALYLIFLFWEWSENGRASSVFSTIFGNVLNLILLSSLLFSAIFLILMPYLQANKILKDVPGGILKANYYFYEKTFEYGWGSSFSSTGYVEIQEFVNLEKTIYIKAKDVSYWIKKEDFEVGNAESFVEFMKKKVKCKIK